MIKVGNTELFNYAELSNYIKKFDDKITEAEEKITKLKEEIVKSDNEINKLTEQDILADDNTYVKELANAKAKKENLQFQIENETQRIAKIKEIKAEGLKKLIPETADQVRVDMSSYTYTVEQEIYRQLQAVRQEQERLLMTLYASRLAVMQSTSEFDRYCYGSEMKRYKKEYSHFSFPNNPFMAHHAFPELGSPLFNIPVLSAIQDTTRRGRAEIYARYSERENISQLPPTLKLQDIDLQAFLDSISTSNEGDKNE